MKNNIRTKTQTGFKYPNLDLSSDNIIKTSKVDFNDSVQIRLLQPKKSISDYKINNKEIQQIKKSSSKPLIGNKASDLITNAKQNSISNNGLAQILMENHIFLKIQDALYYWNDTKGYYISMTAEYADRFIRQSIPDKYKSKINSHSIKEIIQWIKAENTIEANSKYLKRKKDFISFKNCILETTNGNTFNHDPKYYFTSIINAEYPLFNYPSGDYFEKFMEDITGGNTKLYLRIQELIGYVISEIRDVKCIPFLLGPKDTGKSILLRLIEFLVGPESVTNLSFDQLNKPDYLVKLLGKRLNTCGETSEISLNRLDILKKLSGGDTITVRAVFEQPINFVNSAALLFAGNHLPVIKGIDKSNAFSERLVIIPLTNVIAKTDQDIHLFDKLIEESSYIAQWAVEGFTRWRDNNFEFTTCPEILDIEDEFRYKANSIQEFINSECLLDPFSQIHNETLEKSYHKYCLHLNTIPVSNKEFHKFLKSLHQLSASRFRINNQNKNGYRGIRLKTYSENKGDFEHDYSE